MHGVTEAQHDPVLRNVLDAAGMPLVWTERPGGHRLKRRVYGPELMLTFFESTTNRSCRHRLYGGAPGVPERLAETLHHRFPGMTIYGCMNITRGSRFPSSLGLALPLTSTQVSTSKRLAGCVSTASNGSTGWYRSREDSGAGT